MFIIATILLATVGSYAIFPGHLGLGLIIAIFSEVLARVKGYCLKIGVFMVFLGDI